MNNKEHRRNGFSSFGHHSVVIVDETPYVWGRNDFFQLGLGDKIQQHQPRELSGVSEVVAVSLGEDHTLVLKSNGSVFSWGKNNYGQLGRGLKSQFENEPQQIQFEESEEIVAISCGAYYHSMALTSNGEVYTFGHNYYGQLGVGDTKERTKPQKVKKISQIVSVSCGWSHCLALTSGGNVYSWGNKGSGQLGLGASDNENVKLPQKIGQLSDIVAIACGWSHSVSLKKDGTVFTWGSNTKGELGLGHKHNQVRPQKIPNLTHVISIACGAHHTLALTANGVIYSWGFNENGQLGQGNFEAQTEPKKIDQTGPEYFDDFVISIGCGFSHSFAITNKLSFYVWGSNKYGELGLGTNFKAKTQPNPRKLTTLPNALSLGWSIVKSLDPLEILGPLKEEKFQIMLGKLLEGGKYADLVIFVGDNKFSVHKAICSVRCPKLLDVERLDNVDPIIFKYFLKFVYTNIIDDNRPQSLIKIAYLAQALEMEELVQLCHHSIIKGFSPENIFDILFFSAQEGLDQLVDWTCWYIGKNKVPMPTVEQSKQFEPNYLHILKKANEQISHVTLPRPPQITRKLQPLVDALDSLFDTKAYSDFSIYVDGEEIRVHKSILATRWQYFSMLTLKDKTRCEHVTRMSFETFNKLIYYFYTGEMDFTLSDCGWILVSADFYLLSEETQLLQYCDAEIEYNFANKNWLQVLQLAVELDNVDLKERVLTDLPHNLSTQQLVSALLQVMEEQQEQKSTIRKLMDDSFQQEQQQQIVNARLQSTIQVLVNRMDLLENQNQQD